MPKDVDDRDLIDAWLRTHEPTRLPPGHAEGTGTPLEDTLLGIARLQRLSPYHSQAHYRHRPGRAGWDRRR